LPVPDATFVAKSLNGTPIWLSTGNVVPSRIVRTAARAGQIMGMARALAETTARARRVRLK
jgi:hypothetical protein